MWAEEERCSHAADVTNARVSASTLAALLVLNKHLLRMANGSGRPHEALADTCARTAVRAAQQVLSSFLRRVDETA